MVPCVMLSPRPINISGVCGADTEPGCAGAGRSAALAAVEPAAVRAVLASGSAPRARDKAKQPARHQHHAARRWGGCTGPIGLPSPGASRDGLAELIG